MTVVNQSVIMPSVVAPMMGDRITFHDRIKSRQEVSLEIGVIRQGTLTEVEGSVQLTSSIR